MKYNVYIPSKGRAGKCFTVDLCEKYNIPYKVFVESNDYDSYCSAYGEDKIIDVQGNDFGCVAHSRRFIKEYSKSLGEDRHWQVDDDIKNMFRYDAENHKNVIIDPKIMFNDIETEVSKYTNVRIAGVSANTFLKLKKKEYNVNAFPYCVMCIDSNMTYNWEDKTIDDIDMALQILSNGDCTMRFNIYNFYFVKSNKRSGGFTEIRTMERSKEYVMNTFNKWKPLIPKIVSKGNLGCRLYMNSVWSKFRKNELKKK